MKNVVVSAKWTKNLMVAIYCKHIVVRTFMCFNFIYLLISLFCNIEMYESTMQFVIFNLYIEWGDKCKESCFIMISKHSALYVLQITIKVQQLSNELNWMKVRNEKPSQLKLHENNSGAGSYYFGKFLLVSPSLLVDDLLNLWIKYLSVFDKN